MCVKSCAIEKLYILFTLEGLTFWILFAIIRYTKNKEEFQ